MENPDLGLNQSSLTEKNMEPWESELFGKPWHEVLDKLEGHIPQHEEEKSQYLEKIEQPESESGGEELKSTTVQSNFNPDELRKQFKTKIEGYSGMLLTDGKWLRKDKVSK